MEIKRNTVTVSVAGRELKRLEVVTSPLASDKTAINKAVKRFPVITNEARPVYKVVSTEIMEG